MVAGAIPIIYLFVNYEYIVTRIFYIDDLSFTDKAMGVLMVLVVLEATRRVIGLALPITAVVFLLYGLLIARLEPERMLDQLRRQQVPVNGGVRHAQIFNPDIGRAVGQSQSPLRCCTICRSN